MEDEEDFENEYGLDGQNPDEQEQEQNILGEILGKMGIAAVIPIPMPSRLEDLLCPPTPAIVAKLQARLDESLAAAKKWRAEHDGPPTEDLLQIIGQIAQTHALLTRAKSLVN